jgi:DNA-directed RNA polymerase subunit RPC12/RpoP
MAAAFQIAPASTQVDNPSTQVELAYRCDRCRRALGVRFTGYFWVCNRCRTRILRALSDEREQPMLPGNLQRSAAKVDDPVK